MHRAIVHAGIDRDLKIGLRLFDSVEFVKQNAAVAARLGMLRCVFERLLQRR